MTTINGTLKNNKKNVMVFCSIFGLTENNVLITNHFGLHMVLEVKSMVLKSWFMVYGTIGLWVL